MTVEEMIAREAIRYTMSVYNNSGDRGAIDETAACFTDDGEIDTGGVQAQGRAGVHAFLQSVMDSGALSGAAPRPTRHQLTTSRVEFTGQDTARGWTYFLLVRDGSVIQNGIYVDRFRRVGDRWLIEHRRVKLEYSAT